jgi:hypothetical protein
MIEIPIHVNNLCIDLYLMQSICLSNSCNQIDLVMYRIFLLYFENKRSDAGGTLVA